MKIVKKILITILILLLICSSIFLFKVLKREKIVNGIVHRYVEDFQKIGDTMSGGATEIVQKRDTFLDFEEYRNMYFYYVSEDCSIKLLKIKVYDNKEAYEPVKEIYIDLLKKDGVDNYDNVTEIDLINKTYKVMDDYKIVLPIETAKYFLNYDQSLIGNTNKDAVKEIVLDSDNRLGMWRDDDKIENKKDYGYSWQNRKMSKSEGGYNMDVAVFPGQFYIMFDIEEDEMKGSRKKTDITIRKYVKPIKEDVIVPSLEDYTKID